MAATWTNLGGRSRRAVQALTEGAPTLATEGISLDAVVSVIPVVTAPDGETFDGTGNLRGYLYSSILAAWVRVPRVDDDLLDATGLNRVAFPAIPIGQSSGRFALIADGVGLSGGTTMTVDLLCAGRPGEVAL